MTVDIFQPYRDLLAGKKGVWPIEEARPYPGRYKIQRKDGSSSRVAIAPDGNGGTIAEVDGRREDPLKIWLFCCESPVTKAAFDFHKANGRWEDDPKPSSISNRPTDPFECLLADAADRINQAEELLKGPTIETEVQANLARNLQAQILALRKQGDAMHQVEKEPHLEACRRVDTKFRFRETLTNLAANLKLKFEAFMIREDTKRRAAREAEQARLDAERAKKLEDDPVAALTEDPPELPPPEKVQVGGGFGRKAGLKTVWTATLVDPDAAWANLKGNAKLLELMQSIADKAVKAGAREFPGFEVKEGRRAA